MSTISQPGLPFGERSVTDAVREASATATRKSRFGGFSLTTAGPAERLIAPLLGIYLGYAVARLPEVFPVLVVPKLPMVLLGVFMILLVAAIPPDAWVAIWKESTPLKCVAVLFALAIGTMPLGIWMGGSLAFIQSRYIIAVTIFLSCLVFLRDRRTLRIALGFFVLAVASIAIFTLANYDPNPVFFDDAGNQLEASEISIERLRPNVSLSLDANDWGAVVALTVPLALWLSSGGVWRRVFWGAIALVIVGGVVPTSSRGSLLGLVAGALVLISVGATGWRRFWLVAVVLMAGVVFATIATDGQLQRFFSFSGDDYNLEGEGRWYFWRQGIVWMIKRPWGYGIANYGTYFDWLNGYVRAAHSMWVQYGMELGVAGLATVVILCRHLWKRIKSLRRTALGLRRAHGDPADQEAVLNGHVLAMLAGTLVTGSFLSNAYYPLTYMAFGIAGAVILGTPFREAATDGTSVPAPSTKPASSSPGVVRLRRRRGATP